MTSRDQEELIDSLHDILAPHAAYLSKGADDANAYFVPPVFLEALIWIALNVSLPIFVGVSSALIAERFKNKQTERELRALILQKNEVETMKAEVKAMLAQLEEQRTPDPQKRLEARSNFITVLILNGWTEDAATDDAEKSLEVVLASLWNPQQGRT